MPLNTEQRTFDLSDFVNGDYAFLQFTIDSLPVPIFFKDINGVYLGCNNAFEAFIKITRAELVNHSVYQLFDQDLAKIYQRADQELFNNPGVQIYEHEIRTKTDEKVFVKFHKTSFYDKKGKVAGLIGIIFDITEQKILEKKLISNATFDALTGFYNRRQGTDIALESLTLAKKKAFQLATIMVDIDHFKCINDQFGHAAGDNALKNFSSVIQHLKMDQEKVIRWGGEEFLILITASMQQTNFKEYVQQRANAFREAICLTPFELADSTFTVTISCGVSYYQGQTLRELINEADILLYQAKETGRNRVCG